MWFIHGGRATGKTTMLLRQSAMTGCPILAINRPRAEILKARAREMGLKIPDPIVWKKGAHYCNLGVLMDDGEDTVRQVFRDMMGVNVEGMAIGGPITMLRACRWPESAFDSLPPASLARLKAASTDNFGFFCCGRGNGKSHACAGMGTEQEDTDDEND